MGEGDQGVQERCVLAAEGPRREGGEPAPASLGRGDDEAHEGTGGLHRRERQRALQARHLPVLDDAIARIGEQFSRLLSALWRHAQAWIPLLFCEKFSGSFVFLVASQSLAGTAS